MSATLDQISAPPAKPATFTWRRFIFPTAVLFLFGGFFALPWIMIALGLDADKLMPMPVSIWSQWFSPLIGVLLLAFWWVFLAPVAWVVRLGSLAMVAAAVAAFCFTCVNKVELTMGRVSLVPRWHFVWDDNGPPPTDANPSELPDIFAYAGGQDTFPRYRGVNSDGIVGWATLETDWAKTPPTVTWSHPCGDSYSGIAVAGNVLFTLEQRPEGESVVCYDRNTGRQRWASPSKDKESNPISYKDKNWMGDGPRSTPTIDKDQVFTIGATGELACHQIDGKRVWSRNILADAQAKNIKWGMTGSPLIVGDLVIANPGIDEDAAEPANSSLIAYDKAKGEIRWRSGNRPAGYSSPQLTTLDGVPQILLFDGAGLASYESATGKELWNFPWVTDYSMNSIQPLILGKDRVFISSEMKNGCAMLQVKPSENDKSAWNVKVVWQNKNLAARYANPVTDGKSIFGLHNTQGILTCLDAETGKMKWKGDREGPGQLLLAQNALIVVNGEYGDVAIFDPQAKSEAVELGRYQTFQKRDKTWNTPAMAADQLFVRNQTHIVCLKLPRR